MLAETYPATVVCEALECARSSYYYGGKEGDEDRALREAIEGVLVEFPIYGYRRVTKQLRRQGWEVNHKRVARVMREAGLQGKMRRGNRRTTDSAHDYPRYPNLVLEVTVTRPDQVWVSDITYIRLRYEFVYLAVIMDVFTRCIRGWHLGRSLDQSLTLFALQRALVHHTPEIHHSDQGVQYAATAYTERLQEVGAQISMAERGEAWQNGYAERLIRTIKEEEVALSDYEDYADALQQIGQFLDEVYMHKRIHSSLGYLTPVEFAEQWEKEQEGALSLKTP
jgi:transposase InsO family protein